MADSGYHGGVKLLPCALVVMLMTVSSVGLADDESRAKILADEAIVLARANRLSAAVKGFKQAEVLGPRAANICNIGLAYSKMKRWAQAYLFLTSCQDRWLRETGQRPKPWIGRHLGESIAALKQNGYAPVRVTTVPVGASVAFSDLPDDEIFAAPQVFWLAQGEHSVTIRAPGYAVRRRTVVVADESAKTISVALSSLQKPQRTAEPTKGKLVSEVPRTKPSVSATSDSFASVSMTTPSVTPSRLGPALTVGAGALLGLVGGVFDARMRKDDRKFQAGTAEFDLAEDQARTNRIFAISFYAAGAVTVGAGIYWYLRDVRKPTNRRRTTGIALSVDGAVLWTRWIR